MKYNIKKIRGDLIMHKRKLGTIKKIISYTLAGLLVFNNVSLVQAEEMTEIEIEEVSVIDNAQEEESPEEEKEVKEVEEEVINDDRWQSDGNNGTSSSEGTEEAGVEERAKDEVNSEHIRDSEQTTDEEGSKVDSSSEETTTEEDTTSEEETTTEEETTYEEVTESIVDVDNNVVYLVLEGMNLTYDTDSNDVFKIRVDAEFELFEGIEIDGSVVPENMYNAYSGSTVVELYDEYIDSLSEGSHSMRFNFNDGYSEVSFDIVNAIEEDVKEYDITFYMLELMTAPNGSEYTDYVEYTTLTTVNGMIEDYPEVPTVKGATFNKWIMEDYSDVPNKFTEDCSVYAEYDYMVQSISTTLSNDYGTAEWDESTGTLTVLDWGIDITSSKYDYPWYSIKDDIINVDVSNVTELKYSAFCDYSILESIIGLDNVNVIEEMVFYKCYNLSGILQFSNSLTEIGKYAFYNCSNLTGDLVIPDSVSSLGEYAFSGCSGFNGTLTLSNNLTEIGNYAFTNCSGFIGNIVIPNSVTSIGIRAFADCNGFNGTITLSSNLQTLGEGAFIYCENLTGDLVIPDSVTSIPQFAFYFCTKLNGTLTLSSNLTDIGEWSFGRCDNLTGELIIPDGITVINDQAFYGCGFTKVIGNEVTTVSDSGLSSMDNVTEIFLPKCSIAKKSASDDYSSAFNQSSKLVKLTLANDFTVESSGILRMSSSSSPLKVYSASPFFQDEANVNGRVINWDEFVSMSLEYTGNELLPDDIINGDDIKLTLTVKEFRVNEYDNPTERTYTIVNPSSNMIGGLYSYGYRNIPTVMTDDMYGDCYASISVKYQPNASSIKYTKSAFMVIPRVAKVETSRTLTSLNVTYNGATIKEGLTASKADISVKGVYTVNYNYGQPTTIEETIDVNDCNVSIPTTIIGDNTITVEKDGVTSTVIYLGVATAEVGRTLDGITVTYNGGNVAKNTLANKSDFNVVATYTVQFDNSTTTTITSNVSNDDCVFSDLTATSDDVNTVTISYTYGGITKTCTSTFNTDPASIVQPTPPTVPTPVPTPPSNPAPSNPAPTPPVTNGSNNNINSDNTGNAEPSVTWVDVDIIGVFVDSLNTLVISKNPIQKYHTNDEGFFNINKLVYGENSIYLYEADNEEEPVATITFMVDLTGKIYDIKVTHIKNNYKIGIKRDSYNVSKMLIVLSENTVIEDNGEIENETPSVTPPEIFISEEEDVVQEEVKDTNVAGEVDTKMDMEVLPQTGYDPYEVSYNQTVSMSVSEYLYIEDKKKREDE